MLKETTETKETIEPNIVLLSVSPLHTIVEEDTDDLETTKGLEIDDNQRQASNFKAETHLKRFKKISEYYDCNFDACTKAQLAENPSVNKKLARLGGFPHLACNNYLLNSEMNSMYENTLENGVGKTMNTCHETMLATRGNIKNSACLRLGTEMKAFLGGWTKWTGWMYMMDRFSRLGTNSSLQVITRTQIFRLILHCRF